MANPGYQAYPQQQSLNFQQPMYQPQPIQFQQPPSQSYHPNVQMPNYNVPQAAGQAHQAAPVWNLITPQALVSPPPVNTPLAPRAQQAAAHTPTSPRSASSGAGDNSAGNNLAKGRGSGRGRGAAPQKGGKGPQGAPSSS